jgi:hypothetical protein
MKNILRLAALMVLFSLLSQSVWAGEPGTQPSTGPTKPESQDAGVTFSEVMTVISIVLALLSFVYTYYSGRQSSRRGYLDVLNSNLTVQQLILANPVEADIFFGKANVSYLDKIRKHALMAARVDPTRTADEHEERMRIDHQIVLEMIADLYDAIVHLQLQNSIGADTAAVYLNYIHKVMQPGFGMVEFLSQRLDCYTPRFFELCVPADVMRLVREKAAEDARSLS